MAPTSPVISPQGSRRLFRTVALDRNELPHPPGRSAIDAARDAVAAVHTYPSWDAPALRAAIGAHFGVPADWVVAAAGSIAVIQQAMMVAGPGELVLPWPSFDAFPPVARARGLQPVLTPIRPDGACDLNAVRNQLTDQTRMVLICTPNSPTGGALTHGELGALLEQVPEQILVLIDQAYAEFSDHPDRPRPVELAAAHPRVIVTRTFSKAYGLAGLRVGYGLARPEHARSVAAAGVPYAVTTAAEAAAIHVLNQPEHPGRIVRAIHAERARLARVLRDLGVHVVAGQGNFVWVPMSEPVADTVDQLAGAGVRVKGYPGHGIRITVGTSADTDALLRAWSILAQPAAPLPGPRRRT